MDRGKVIIYQTPDGDTQLDVKLENETVWINRQQMSELFERDIKTVGKHINNALKEELIEVPVVAKFATTATDGKIYQMEYYNLEEMKRINRLEVLSIQFIRHLTEKNCIQVSRKKQRCYFIW